MKMPLDGYKTYICLGVAIALLVLKGTGTVVVQKEIIWGLLALGGITLRQGVKNGGEK